MICDSRVMETCNASHYWGKNAQKKEKKNAQKKEK